MNFNIRQDPSPMTDEVYLFSSFINPALFSPFLCLAIKSSRTFLSFVGEKKEADVEVHLEERKRKTEMLPFRYRFMIKEVCFP